MLPLYGNSISKADLDPASDRMPVLDVSQIADAKHRDITIKDAVEKVGDTRYRIQGTAVPWTDLSGIPGSFTPSAHTHTWSEVTGKPTTFPPDTHTHTWLEVTGKPTTFPPDNHTHVASDIISGTFPAARFAGTATNGFALLLVAGVPTWQQQQLATRATNLSQVFAMGSDEVLTGIDPNADRLLWWNNTTKRFEYLGIGGNLSVSGGSLNATGGSGIPVVDVQRFTASGIWTNPSPSVPRLILVRIFGGGGSGGSGRASATGDRYGGGGGGAGGMVEIFVMSDRLGSTEAVTVGAGGATAAGVNATSDGNPGNAGGNSTFGPLTARGGTAGGAGLVGSGSGATAQAAIGFGLNNAALNATAGASSSISGVGSLASRASIFPCSGGAGGGIDTAGTGRAGGLGEGMQLATTAFVYSADRSTGGAAGAAGGAGETGSQNNSPFFAGAGGGGGGAGTTTTGGAGGAGGFPGGGGGGGGAGTTASGAGGAGGNGYVEVITYL